MGDINSTVPIGTLNINGLNTPNKSICAQLLSCVQLFATLWTGPPGSSVCRIFQARILEWAAISSSRGSSWPRDQIWVSCIAGGFFTTEPSWGEKKCVWLAQAILSGNSPPGSHDNSKDFCFWNALKAAWISGVGPPTGSLGLVFQLQIMEGSASSERRKWPGKTRHCSSGSMDVAWGPDLGTYWAVTSLTPSSETRRARQQGLLVASY